LSFVVKEISIRRFPMASSDGFLLSNNTRLPQNLHGKLRLSFPAENDRRPRGSGFATPAFTLHFPIQKTDIKMYSTYACQ
jgi:hypothetical protein